MKVAPAETVLRSEDQFETASDDQAGLFPCLSVLPGNECRGIANSQRLIDAMSLAGAEDQGAAVRALDESRLVIRRSIDEARRRCSLVEQLRDTEPGTNAWYARELVQVKNGWDDLSQLWPPKDSGAERLPAMLQRSMETIKVLDELIFTCACQTIPDELNNYLDNYRIGVSLDFVATFRDQLSNDEMTRKVLASLVPQSAIVSGLIDLAGGKVIKADRRLWRQVISAVAVSGAVGLGFLLIALAVYLGSWLQYLPRDWPANPWKTISGYYVMVLLGVLCHWVLDRLKQNRAGADVTPFSEWLMWIHINEVPIVVRIATVWVLLGLGIGFQFFKLTSYAQPLTCFTAGFFIDSTFDALIGRFNTFMSDQDSSKKSSPKTGS